ncbi:Bug family tripartite tricarboxylate transporter substrate binding protein [Anaerosinus massiliensis]|uniref:Bug family tripartite tricarboxylate transporter substrate binding protein n=1 Tax=Massilibacillus massiliensis TaxID=1806837 RepID=UPI000A4173A1|nr:tripartite tricarboxylate transporter substrate binding protein [Massilibacillus massiliensis]
MKTQAEVSEKKYPTKPITLIVPFSAGGGLDLVARSLEKMAPKYLGQPLVVINKPGGSGTIGWNELVSSPSDGYTLGISAIDVLVQSLYGTTKYHYPTALEPIAQITTSPWILVVNADLPCEDINSFIQYAKNSPQNLKLGHPGIGTLPHILGEKFSKLSDTKFDEVPFRGASDVVASLLGNHIQFSFINPSTVKEHIKNGTLKAIAITGDHRLTDPELEKIPTFKELGFDIVLTNWFGIAAPKDMPPEVRTKLDQALKEIAADPEFKTNIENLGLQLEYLNSDESKDKWISDGDKLYKSIEETGILDQIKAQKN